MYPISPEGVSSDEEVNLATLDLPESSIVVELQSSNEDFQQGDHLVVDLCGVPHPGDYLMHEDSPGKYSIRKFISGTPVIPQSPLVSDYCTSVHNSRGIVVRVIKKHI